MTRPKRNKEPAASDLEDLCRQVVENSSLPMVTVTAPEHVICYVNPAFCTFAGKTSEELIGVPLCRVVPMGNDCLPLLERVYSTGVSQTYMEQDREQEPPGGPPRRAYSMWVIHHSATRPTGILIQVIDAHEAALSDRHTVAISQELMLTAVRLHEQLEAADRLSAEQRKEISARKRAEEALRESDDRLRRIARSARVGFFEWNATKDSAYWSPEHYELFGFEPGTPINWNRWIQSVHPEDRDRVRQNAFQLLERGREEEEVRGHKYEYRVVHPDGSVVWLESDLSLNTAGGEVIVEGILHDISDRKRYEEELNVLVAEKENLLRELSHRTKNNIQVVSNLLKLQGVRSMDDRVINALDEAQDRIQAMALVYEKLYKSGGVLSLSVKEYAKDLAYNLLKSHQGTEGPVKLVLELEELSVPHDVALPVGLIINELVSNSLKHAFQNGKPGTVFITLRTLGEKLELRYRDDGPGFPEDFDISRVETLGLKLVRNLAVHQLRGTMELVHDSGTEFVFRFLLRATKSSPLRR